MHLTQFVILASWEGSDATTSQKLPHVEPQILLSLTQTSKAHCQCYPCKVITTGKTLWMTIPDFGWWHFCTIRVMPLLPLSVTKHMLKRRWANPSWFPEMTKEENSSVRSILTTLLIMESDGSTLNQGEPHQNGVAERSNEDIAAGATGQTSSLLLGTSCCHLCAYQKQDAHF